MAKARTLPGWPAALCEEWAAAYVGQLSVGTFRTEVKAGRMPKPIAISNGRVAWLTKELDAYLDALGGAPPTPANDAVSVADAAAEWDLACYGNRGVELS